MWRVRWHEAGRVRRKFFSGRDAADSHASDMRGELVTARRKLASLPSSEQQQLILLHEEAKRRGVNLATLLSLLSSAEGKPTAAPTCQAVLEEMELVKRKAGRNADYISNLTMIAGQFIEGQEKLGVDQVTFQMVEAFIDGRNRNYRSTLRSRLSTYFKFAVRRGYRSDNPCDRLESVSVPHVTPSVFTVSEVEKCLKYLKAHPKMLAWFVLSTFAGLRPEEAQKTTWNEINLDEGWIRVEAQTSKVRQRRVVYPLPMAIEWLKFAKAKKSELPLSTKQRTLGRNELRDLLEWKEWKQDVTRHTAASYWLAHSGSAATVATALGHSESILRKNYMALVTKSDAAKFWAISPTPSSKLPPVPAARL